MFLKTKKKIIFPNLRIFILFRRNNFGKLLYLLVIVHLIKNQTHTYTHNEVEMILELTVKIISNS